MSNPQEHLTNEWLSRLFENPFTLVNYAIRQARAKIAKGDVRSPNAAVETLELLGRKQASELHHSSEEKEGLESQQSESPQSYSSGRKKDFSTYSWKDVK